MLVSSSFGVDQQTEEECSQDTRSNTEISPIVLKRSRIISNYLKSPTPKKKYKENNCFFCVFGATSAEHLELHLNNSKSCLKYYHQHFKCTSTEAILASLCSCHFCPFTSKMSLKPHLKTQKPCLLKYLKKFNMTTLTEVTSFVSKLRKKLYPSRNKASRKLEYEKGQMKKKNETAMLTKIDLLNKYRKDTTFTNTKHCYHCEGNFSDSRASQMSEEIENPDNSKRRFETFFVCSNCKDGKSKNVEAKIKFDFVEKGTQVLYAPIEFINSNIRESEILQTESSGDQDKDIMAITCMFPCNIESLNFVDPFKCKQRADNYGKLYVSSQVDKELMSLLYENEIFKFQESFLYFETILPQSSYYEIKQDQTSDRYDSILQWLQTENGLVVTYLLTLIPPI